MAWERPKSGGAKKPTKKAKTTPKGERLAGAHEVTGEDLKNCEIILKKLGGVLDEVKFPTTLQTMALIMINFMVAKDPKVDKAITLIKLIASHFHVIEQAAEEGDTYSQAMERISINKGSHGISVHKLGGDRVASAHHIDPEEMPKDLEQVFSDFFESDLNNKPDGEKAKTFEDFAKMKPEELKDYIWDTVKDVIPTLNLAFGLAIDEFKGEEFFGLVFPALILTMMGNNFDGVGIEKNKAMTIKDVKILLSAMAKAFEPMIDDDTGKYPDEMTVKEFYSKAGFSKESPNQPN